MKYQPLSDRVLVARAKAEEKTPGGILIPENAKEKPIRGEVLAVGAGRRLDSGDLVALQVKPGDVVVFGKYSGTEMPDGHVFLREDEILCIVRE